MTIFRTSRGNEVPHLHRSPDLNAAEKAMARSFMSDLFPASTEIGPPTRKYNCHGYALADSHGWFGEPDLFYADDFDGASLESPAVGDVVLYMRRSLVTHTAKVTRVDAANKITQLQSKWGEAALVTHQLAAVPGVYGRPVALLRRIPSALPAPSALTDAEEDTASDDQPLEPLLTSMSDSAGDSVQFNLMLASTPEVRQRIMDSFSRQEFSESASFSHIDTLKGDATQEEIDEALAQLSSAKVHFMLMLASVDDVTTRIIESLPEVQTVVKMGTKAGTAVLNLFAREETQDDDRLTSILLYLLSRFKVRKAAVPLFDYLFYREHSKYNHGLALQAFLAASAIE